MTDIEVVIPQDLNEKYNEALSVLAKVDNTMVGNDEQLAMLEVAMLNPETPNAMILGPQGIGKTALVEQMIYNKSLTEYPTLVISLSIEALGELSENVEENSITQKRSFYQNVVPRVAEEQTDIGYNDFLVSREELQDADINDQIRDYINENYDADFFVVKISEEIDEDRIREELTEDLLLNLTTTEPYRVVPREYWNDKARRVPDIQELSQYTETDGLEPFVEKYAPDWEEIADENQEE